MLGKQIPHVLPHKGNISECSRQITKYIPHRRNADGLTVDCKKKYGKQLQAIKENYRIFDIPHNGKANKGKDIRENVISSTVTGAVAGNLKIKGSYNGSKATISKLTKKMTANPITGRMAGVLTKRERKALKSAISD